MATKGPAGPLAPPAGAGRAAAPPPQPSAPLGCRQARPAAPAPAGRGEGGRVCGEMGLCGPKRRLQPPRGSVSLSFWSPWCRVMTGPMCLVPVGSGGWERE